MTVLTRGASQQDRLPRGTYDQSEDDQPEDADQQEMKPMPTPGDQSPTPHPPDAAANNHDPDKGRDPVRLSINLSLESSTTLRNLVTRKGLSITEGIRRAIAIWKFLEDETDKGNQIAVVDRNDVVHKIFLV